MSLLSVREALDVSDSFLQCLYGEEIFMRWRELKLEMSFVTERDYVSWLMDVADALRSQKMAKEVVIKSEPNSDEYQDRDESWKLSVEIPHSQAPPMVRVLPNSTTLLTDKLLVESPEFHHSPPMPLDEVTPNGATPSTFSEHEELGDVYPEHAEEAVDSSLPPSADSSFPIPTIENKEDVLPHDDSLEIVLSSEDDRDIAGGHDVQLDDINDNEYLSGAELIPQPIMESVVRRKRARILHPCPHCSYASQTKGNVTRHVHDVHNKQRSERCPHCAYVCSQRVVLRSHLIGMHGYPSRHCCPTCGRYFPTPYKLLGHMKTRCVINSSPDADSRASN